MDYAFNHEGKNYTPNGTVGIQDAEQHNNEQEQAEIAWLKTGPDKVFLYVKMPLTMATQYRAWANGDNPREVAITTWLGTHIASHIWIGQRRISGFQSYYQGGTYRRAVSCRIFGVQYHGWYFESSGSYCRLRKGKKQPSK